MKRTRAEFMGSNGSDVRKDRCIEPLATNKRTIKSIQLAAHTDMQMFIENSPVNYNVSTPLNCQ